MLNVKFLPVQKQIRCEKSDETEIKKIKKGNTNENEKRDENEMSSNENKKDDSSSRRHEMDEQERVRALSSRMT